MYKDIITRIQLIPPTWRKANEHVISKFTPSFDLNRIRTVMNTANTADKNITLQSFDSDSDTIIIDNSANCIVWKQIMDFIDSTYQEISQDLGTTVNTVHGKGMPIGIGTIQIGWYDDYGKYHGFELPDIYHMPNSCTNNLGVPEFSRIIGDSKHEGTGINSSAMSSVFTWNDQQFVRHFKHPASHLPEMTVNDGFSIFQKFCNVIDKIVPHEAECHHLNQKA